MHIAFIHKEFPCGGAEQATIDIANYLVERGHRATVLVQHHNAEDYPRDCRRLFAVEPLPEGGYKHSRHIAQHVVDFVRREGVDVLATYRQLLYMPWLKQQVDVKVVFVLHSLPFYEMIDCEEKKKESRAKRLLYSLGGAWLLEQFYLRKYRSVYAWADAYGVLCEGYKQIVIEKLGLSASDNRLHVLPNCTHLPDNVVREKQKTIVFVGRLTRRDKRVDRLLRIWAEASRALPEWTLKIVGDGKDRKNLERLSAELGLERILFEGFSTQVKSYLDEASVACMTSSFEGWPLSVAEAQANGVVPVLFNSFAGASDLVSSPDEGLLIPPFDEHAYARALTALCQDPARLKEMQEAVLQKSQRYTLARMGEAWMQTLNTFQTLKR